MVEQEIRVQQILSHQYIAPILDVVYEKDVIIIIMDYYKRGDLFNLMMNEHTSYQLLSKLFAQVVSAVMYLHNKEIAHLDIKPENIFIDDQLNAKLADFGCCETPQSRKRPFFTRGTLIYAAPEIFNHTLSDNRPADVWALGVILYSMTTRYLPWRPGTDDEIQLQIKNEGIQFSEFMPPNVISIVKRCCIQDPTKRITINELFDLVKHDLPAEGRHMRKSKSIAPPRVNLLADLKENNSIKRSRRVTLHKSHYPRGSSTSTNTGILLSPL